MIDVAIRLSVSDGRRRFDLDAAFAADAPAVALYGASGAGKSLMLQAMAGLLRPAQGHVRVGGRTLYDSAQGIDQPARERIARRVLGVVVAAGERLFGGQRDGHRGGLLARGALEQHPVRRDRPWTIAVRIKLL